MSSRIVKYWHKLTEDTFEPLAINKVGLGIEMKANGLKWCKTCVAAVKPEGKLDAQGILDVCPFCGEEL